MHEIEHAHSELGPSSSERWLNCSGSVLLIRGMDAPGSEYAAYGVAGHTLSEWCRVQQKSAFDFIGQTLKVDSFEFVVDNEMASAVDEFCEYVEALPGAPLYEERVGYEKYVPSGFGTLDDGRVGDVLYITDLKMGTGIQVFAKDNPQLKLYALGAYLKYGHLLEDLDKVVLTVYQPRLNHIDVWETDIAAILVWAETVVKPTAAIALKPGAPFKAGDWCQFCPAKRTCRARADAVLQTVAGEFGDLDAPRTPALLTNDEIAKLLPNLELVKKWCADMNSHALSEIAKGNAVGNWKVVEGRSVTVFKASKEEVAARLEPVLGKAALYTEPELKSAPQIKDALADAVKAKQGLKGKKRDEAVAALLDGLTHKPKGKPKLAPGDDPRPSMAVDVTMEFDNLEEFE